MLLPTSSLGAFCHPGEMDRVFLHKLHQWEELCLRPSGWCKSGNGVFTEEYDVVK